MAHMTSVPHVNFHLTSAPHVVFNSCPPYLREVKCCTYTKGRKHEEMLTVRIRHEARQE